MIGYACAVMDSYAKHVFISVQEIPFSSHDIPNIQLVALCVRSNAGPCLPRKQQQKLLFALDKFFFSSNFYRYNNIWQQNCNQVGDCCCLTCFLFSLPLFFFIFIPACICVLNSFIAFFIFMNDKSATVKLKKVEHGYCAHKRMHPIPHGIDFVQSIWHWMIDNNMTKTRMQNNQPLTSNCCHYFWCVAFYFASENDNTINRTLLYDKVSGDIVSIEQKAFASVWCFFHLASIGCSLLIN